MDASLRGSLVIAVAGLALVLTTVCAVNMAGAAEDKKDKKAAKPPAAAKPATATKPAAAAKPSAAARTDRSGTAHVQSTRASGAASVAKQKACFGEAPKIETVKPDEAKAGEKVTITGRSFGAQGCLSAVSFGPGHEAKSQQVNETTLTATVPDGGRKGIRLLTVTNSGGEDSKPFLVK